MLCFGSYWSLQYVNNTCAARTGAVRGILEYTY